MQKKQKEPKKGANLLGSVAISLATICLCLFGTEKTLKYTSANPPYQWDRRLMFFSEGNVFQNQGWGGFVYKPNARIRSQTFYITDLNAPRHTEEYAYEIRTNSSGLVQLADISTSRPSIIFLGDSYTEGQGALPWFYQLESRWPQRARYQIINGGILGTGFEAWERLYQDISKTTEISRIVIIFISSDWIRPVWQFPDQELECLKDVARCTGADNYFGLPENPAEADIQINRIVRARIDYLAEQNIFKSSAIYKRLLLPAYYRWWPYRKAKDEMQFRKSKDAIEEMSAKLGHENLLFIQLPQKDEMVSGPDFMGQKGRDFIRRNGFSFVDGFEKCGLKITDFHVHDGHPNESGYSKIAECVDRSVREVFPPS
jgi:hypothetical protein